MKEITLEEILQEKPIPIRSKPVRTRRAKPFKPHTPFQQLLKNIGVDETFSILQKKETKFNHFINNVPLFPNYNIMLDTLYLPTTDKAKYKYLLVAVDLGSNVVDFQQMATNTAQETLSAMQQMFKRKYIKKPQFSINTDGGSEFKSVFDKFCKDNSIFHKTSFPYRHKQQSPVESLNKTLARILLGYLNNKEQKSGKKETDWTPILEKTREELNKYRIRMDIDEMRDNQSQFNLASAGVPVFKVGQKVHYKLSRPMDALNNPIKDDKFRKGDMRYSPDTRTIVEIVYMNDYPYYRYILNDMPNVSFSAYELVLSKNEEETFLVRKIWDKTKINGTTHYKVWWKEKTKKDSTWEPEEKLLEDGLDEHIQEFEEEHKAKKKKINQARAKKKRQANK